MRDRPPPAARRRPLRELADCPRFFFSFFFFFFFWRRRRRKERQPGVRRLAVAGGLGGSGHRLISLPLSSRGLASAARLMPSPSSFLISASPLYRDHRGNRVLLFGPARSGKTQLLRRSAAAAGAAVFSLRPAVVEAAAPAFESLYRKSGCGGDVNVKDKGTVSSASSTKGAGGAGGSGNNSCRFVVAAAFAAARACSCPSVVHLPCAESLFVSDAGGGNRGATLAGCSLPPAATMMPSLSQEASRLRARERLVIVGESSRVQEAVGKKDSTAMARFFAGGLLPVGAPSGIEERRAVVVAVAEASGARLEGATTAAPTTAEAAAAVAAAKTGKAAAATTEARTKRKTTATACPAAALEALFFTTEGWVAGDLASAVRGALEARRRRPRTMKGASEAAAEEGSGGSNGNNVELEKASPRPPPPPPPLSPAPPLSGPLTAREIVDSLLSGPRPPKASELAAALDWARAAAEAAVVFSGEEDATDVVKKSEKDGGGNSKREKRAPSATTKRDTSKA